SRDVSRPIFAQKLSKEARTLVGMHRVMVRSKKSLGGRGRVRRAPGIQTVKRKAPRLKGLHRESRVFLGALCLFTTWSCSGSEGTGGAPEQGSGGASASGGNGAS